MKPFDLDKAKAGAPIITRSGRKVRLIDTTRKTSTGYPLVAAVTNTYGNEDIIYYTAKGRFCDDDDDEYGFDLFMASVKHEGWINIYPNDSTGAVIYPSRSLADDNASYVRLACVHIEWEE